MSIKGYVYLAASARSPGLIKIGNSRSPAERMRQIKCPAGGRCHVLRSIGFETYCADSVERTAHGLLVASRVCGEWFRVSEREALWAVLAAQKDRARRTKPHPEKPFIPLALERTEITIRRGGRRITSHVYRAGQTHYEPPAWL